MARKCSTCLNEKDESLFPKDKRVKSGLRASCKMCYAKLNSAYHKKRGETSSDLNRRLKRTFGIGLDVYTAMLEDQDFKCAICGKTEQENKKRLAVDHCHKTGKVRKLLCHHCNCALGMVNDNEDTLVSMLSYLKENS